MVEIPLKQAQSFYQIIKQKKIGKKEADNLNSEQHNFVYKINFLTCPSATIH